MTSEFVLSVVQEAIRVTLYISGPLVLLALVVGLVVSVVQAATQIQEMTLVFVPKMLAVFLGLGLFASFMLDALARFTLAVFDLAATASVL
ncbi:MAG TPA: flagellar biosynthetic protein FliQ [Deltaproteobacteria bacterium]|nr:flagellar biosynthetic protein FliQ [Deltaproteobacteria bacterium]HCP45070.1 flagellar biosynthetic protein FliQ [Deltaproteobacteria bacterium]|tara:strand:- start:2833 stop:3105 length:273 start_codon:yes stop_codon:yes gene_type:complete